MLLAETMNTARPRPLAAITIRSAPKRSDSSRIMLSATPGRGSPRLLNCP